MTHPIHRFATSALGTLATVGILCSVAPASLAQEGAKKPATETPKAAGKEAGKKKKAYTPPKLETGVDLGKIKPKAREVPVVKQPTPDERLNERVRAAAASGADKREGPFGRGAFDAGTERFDFGELVEGVEASHTFKLRNGGEGDLVIKRIKPSCGCTLADTLIASPGAEPVVYEPGKPIPPGSEIEVHATLKTKGKRGNASSSIALYTDDPDNAVFRLHLSSQVQSVLEVEPSQINFGHSTPGEKLEGKLSFKNPTGKRFILSVADDQVVPDEMTIDLVAVEPDAEGRSDRWEATVNLGPGLQEGVRNYPLHFVSDMPMVGAVADEATGAVPTYDVRSYAMAQVIGVVFAQPSFVNFSLVRPGQVVARTFRVATRELDYQFPENPEVSIKGFRGEFEYPDNVETTIRMAEDRKSFEVDVRVLDLPEDLEGSFAGFIEVGVKHPTKESLQVRFSGICRKAVGEPTPVRGAQGPK